MLYEVITISAEVCTVYSEQGRDVVRKQIEAEVLEGVAFIEKEMGKKFGDAADPLLVSVRSGSRASMPGMMDTILNLGLNDEAVKGLVITSYSIHYTKLYEKRASGEVRVRRAGRAFV